ncbi:MAG: class I SAM-dependent methyltransferase [Candidatus Omnitrophota bacterium]
MKQIYDDIAQKYAEALKSIKRKYTLEETFLDCVGKIEGKNILDVACGEGYYARLLKTRGANKVVGVDISASMLAIARDQEKIKPLGVEYECFNAASLPVLGKFDVVTAAFLLHYSKTKEELSEICKNVCLNLKPGGKFVTLNLNPAQPLQLDKRYDSTIIATGPLREGAVLKVTLYLDSRKICSFDNYHWAKRTYEAALSRAGFDGVNWRDIKVSKEGIEKFGSDFWQDYLRQPGVIVIECNK